MAFMVEFQSCMHGSGLPTPDEIYDSVSDALDPREALELLDMLKDAAEAAGGLEITLGALEAAGAIGLGGLAMDVAAVTVSAYVGAYTGCLIAATGSSIFDYLTAAEIGSSLRDEIQTAAYDSGLVPGEANA